jgi:hypothetical protein
MRNLGLLVSFVLVGGCSRGLESGNSQPDASTIAEAPPPSAPDSATADAADAAVPDAASPPPPTCDYTEQHDTQNDTVLANGNGQPSMPEATGFTDAMGKVICGNVDMTHYPYTRPIVDIDVYAFSLAADSEVRIELYGAGLESLNLGLWVVDPNESAVNYYGGRVARSRSAVFVKDHAVLIDKLPAGDYTVEMEAATPELMSEPSSLTPIPYKIRFSAFSLAAACPMATGAATHVEGAADNDVLTYRYNTLMSIGFRQLTTKTTDSPESTGITLTPGTTASIMANIGSEGTALDGDDYLERDTFEFQSGTANEVIARVDWGTGTTDTTDIDFFLLPQLTMPPAHNWSALTQSTNPQIGSATNAPPLEAAITSIEPGQPYWLMAGAYTGSTQPSPYTVTLCPLSFTPPPN